MVQIYKTANNNLTYLELAFDLVAKTHGLYMRSHEFEIRMGEIICYNNKGIK